MVKFKWTFIYKYGQKIHTGGAENMNTSQSQGFVDKGEPEACQILTDLESGNHLTCPELSCTKVLACLRCFWPNPPDNLTSVTLVSYYTILYSIGTAKYLEIHPTLLSNKHHTQYLPLPFSLSSLLPPPSPYTSTANLCVCVMPLNIRKVKLDIWPWASKNLTLSACLNEVSIL